MEKFISNSENETKLIGKKLASNFKKGDVIVLTGDLGSGKTKFTEGVLQYYGLDEDISSPTFTIVNEYQNKNITIYHFDVYRLENEDEFYAIGGEEYFQKGICLIEWGEMIENVLPKEYIHITFSKNINEENKREIIVENVKRK